MALVFWRPKLMYKLLINTRSKVSLRTRTIVLAFGRSQYISCLFLVINNKRDIKTSLLQQYSSTKAHCLLKKHMHNLYKLQSQFIENQGKKMLFIYSAYHSGANTAYRKVILGLTKLKHK